MRLLFLILLFPFLTEAQTILINGVGKTVMINAPGNLSTVSINSTVSLVSVAAIETIVAGLDTTGAMGKYYSAFPYVSCFPSDGEIVSIYKKASNHAIEGPIRVTRSMNGGATWTENSIMINGEELICPAYAMERAGNRLIVSYNISSTDNKYYFAYSDDRGYTWTDAGEVTLALSGYTNILWYRPVVMPGKILQVYYGAPLDPVADPCIQGTIQSTDNGETWSLGPTINSQFAKLEGESSATAIANGRGTLSEPTMVITDTGATYADTKLAIYARNEDYTGFTHFKSSDGGATWTRNMVTFLLDFEPTNFRRPVAMIRYGDSMIVATGNRTNGDYRLKYFSCTPDQLFNNDISNYGEVQQHPYDAVSDSVANTSSFGYHEMFIDGVGQLAAHFYDADPRYTLEKKWILIKQIVIKSIGP